MVSSMEEPDVRRILIVEDDRDIAELVALHLGDLSIETDLAADGKAALERLERRPYSLVILDLMLPELDGLEVCKRLRARQDYTPILMLTAKATELDRVLGLEVGADDYLTKPFSVLELVARVKAILRRVEELGRKPASARRSVEIGNLAIDPDRRRVTVDGRALELTAKEFDLLLYFASHPGLVFSRSQLLDQVWGYGHDGYEHTVNSHINRLRSKLEPDPASPRYIQTVWGVGYRFAEDLAAEGGRLEGAGMKVST
jgi:DNA-binding response OmpR family regulator